MVVEGAKEIKKEENELIDEVAVRFCLVGSFS